MSALLIAGNAQSQGREGKSPVGTALQQRRPPGRWRDKGSGWGWGDMVRQGWGDGETRMGRKKLGPRTRHQGRHLLSHLKQMSSGTDPAS